jgi:hypothetical protein
MALHVPAHRVPAHHAPAMDQRLLRDLGVAVVLAVVLLLVLAVPNLVRITVGPPEAWPAERISLDEFRAGERADRTAVGPSSGAPLIELRPSDGGPLP